MSPHPILEVLVSCMNQQQPPALFDGALPPEVGILAINQCPEGNALEDWDQPGVRMRSFVERGLSRSRNRAIDGAKCEIVLFADEDQTLLASAHESIRAAFDAIPGADIITFQHLDRESGKPARSYSGTFFRHNRLSIASVCSIEIAALRSSLDGLRFDTRFGLGTTYPAGEENIFLADALRLGLRCFYWPASIAAHEGPSSGQRLWDASAAQTKGAVLRRMYPVAWPAMVGTFALMKRGQFHDSLSLGGWLKHSCKGALDLRR